MVHHATFTIEREFDAPVEKVFSAFSDLEKKKMWFFGPEGEDEQMMDFRVGGIETSSGKIHGIVHEFKAMYYDIVPNERIIFVYDMFVNNMHFSVSLTSVEFENIGSKTKLMFTEQDMFLSEEDTVEGRKKGTEDLMDQLQKFVEVKK